MATLIHIRLHPSLIAALDKAAQELYLTRSECIRQAIVEKIRSMQPSVAKSPTAPSVDLLMTDQQLADLRQALMIEERRRRYNRRP